VSLAEIIGEHESHRKTLTVRNQDAPEPIERMLRRMVEAPDVEVRDGDPEEEPGNVLVLEGEHGPKFAVSTLEDVAESVLLVNADLYITGTRSVDEVDTPEVIAGLAETTFTVADKRKMLLIEICRHVESLAHRHGSGRLHAGFQQLSRIDDERGTRQVYEDLVDVGVDAHVYGIGPPEGNVTPDGVTVHASDDEEIRRSWFVVSTDCPRYRKAALLAREVGPNEWSGFWTFEPELVDRVDRYLRETYWA